MKFPLLLGLLALLGGGLLDAKDFKVIDKLPQRLAQVRTECHAGWASGVTANMKNASYQYNNAMVVMIKDLLAAYYPKEYMTDESTEDYLKALYTARHYRKDIGNPSGEPQGTMAPLEVVGEVSGDLEETISEMVRAIVADEPKFSYKGWAKKWQQAIK